MTRMFLSLVLLITATASAHQASQNGDAAGKVSVPTAASASHLTIRGCVEGDKEQFTLLQVSTGANFELHADPRIFKDASGKLVEVQADEMAPSARTGLQSLPQLQISHLRVLNDRCPIQGKGKVASASQSSSAQTRPRRPATPCYQQNGAPDQRPPAVGINPNEAGTTGTPSPGTGNPPKQ